MNKIYKNNFFEKIRVLSGAQLKYIAFISMLIDHINKALLYPILQEKGILQQISNLFEILGRIAFPLFSFFLVEGFFKTRNRWKYLSYLLIFGIISEIPYNLFQSAVFFEPNSNNVMFTLSLSLVTIWIIDVLKKKIKNKYIWYFISFIIVAVMCLVAMVLGLDYEKHGILIGYFFYIFYDKPFMALIFGYISIFKEFFSLLGFGFTLFYNGKRGRQNKILNYLFYPVHLLILGLLRLYFKI